MTQALEASYGSEVFKNNFKSKERTVEEGLELCKALAKAGVDAFDVDKGCYDNWFWPHPPAYFEDIPYVEEIAGTLKKYFTENSIKAKVIAVGKLGKPEKAEEVLEKGYADFFMLGRPLLADPYWPCKVSEGKIKEINHCIGDQEGCIQSFILGGHPCCAINPYTGFEETKKLVKTDNSKRVAVIGGGPGGCEAAKTAFLRGHDVTLFEEKGSLGGQLELGSKMKIKHDLLRYVTNLKYQMMLYEQKGLKVKLNTKAILVDLKDKFDVIICATGLNAKVSMLQGIEGIKYCEARELLQNNMELPSDVKKVTVVGGGVVGCEIAYSLSYEKALQVTIVEMLPNVMTGVVQANRSMLLWMMMGDGSPTNKEKDKLKDPVKIYNASQVVKFENGKVFIKANKGRKNQYTPWNTLVPENIHNPFDKALKINNTEELSFDTDYVIFSTGGSSMDDLYYNLLKEKAAPKIFSVGDGRKLGRAWEAISEANEVARNI
ncbi:MAG TPA: FAD-dependent oxidoreductase [Clostridiaceae bacterium]